MKTLIYLPLIIIASMWATTLWYNYESTHSIPSKHLTLISAWGSVQIYSNRSGSGTLYRHNESEFKRYHPRPIDILTGTYYFYNQNHTLKVSIPYWVLTSIITAATSLWFVRRYQINQRINGT